MTMVLNETLACRIGIVPIMASYSDGVARQIFFDQVIGNNKAIVNLQSTCRIVCRFSMAVDVQTIHQPILQICLVKAASLIAKIIVSGG
ncbi:MAG: hypothetical protein WCO61_05910 [Alphaproteobacteria bacterium]